MTELGFGFRVGHWTDGVARTGCTVVLPPPGNVTSCDVRGSSPGSRELESLHPDRRLTEVHAILLTGGSAFGLAAADGVMAWLAEHDVGYRTKVATVPIVPAAVIFDLGSGSVDVRPGPVEGRAACEAASEDVTTGAIGAGVGATVGKWAGLDFLAPGGLGVGRATSGARTVSAMAVVNSVGDVVGDDGAVVAGTSNPRPEYIPPAPPDAQIAANTVLAVVTTDATLDKRDVHWLAGRGSDGITISVRPAHTRYDGDVVFAVATGASETSGTDLDILGYLATQAVASAVRNAVTGA